MLLAKPRNRCLSLLEIAVFARHTFGSRLDGPCLPILTQLRRKRPQHLRSVPSPRTSVHARQGRRFLTRQAFEDRARVRGVGEVIQRRAERFARTEDVGLGERRLAGAALREQVAAEEGARRSPS